MKKVVLVFVSLAIGAALHAQSDAIKQYVETYREIAINEMIRTGVPAAITLAQGIVESQAGQSELVKQSNNHFGIKCKTEWTGPYVLHDDDRKNECFRVYASAEESFKDHSDFLKNRPYYTDLFTLNPADYKAWAKGLKTAGYATERNYPEMLIKMIEVNELQQYSLIALERMQHKDSLEYADADTSDKNQETALQPQASDNKNKPAVKPATTDAAIIAPTEKNNTTVVMVSEEEPADNNIANTASYPEGVFTINETRVIYAKAGTSLLALASNYNITYSSLIEFNELNKKDILDRDRLVYLEKKPKKGGKDYHIVTTAETLEDIAQKEGVRLESLLQYNTLSKGQQPAEGTKIYLRVAVGSLQRSRKA